MRIRRIGGYLLVAVAALFIRVGTTAQTDAASGRIPLRGFGV